MVAFHRGDDFRTRAFVGRRAGRIGEAVVGEFDAAYGVASECCWCEGGEKEGEEGEERMVHFGGESSLITFSFSFSFLVSPGRRRWMLVLIGNFQGKD